MVTEKIVFTSKANYPLTYGKVYDGLYDNKEVVYSSTGYYYYVLSDDGVCRYYYYQHFTPLDKWREQNIENIIYHERK